MYRKIENILFTIMVNAALVSTEQMRDAARLYIFRIPSVEDKSKTWSHYLS